VPVSSDISTIYMSLEQTHNIPVCLQSAKWYQVSWHVLHLHSFRCSRWHYPNTFMYTRLLIQTLDYETNRLYTIW